jgi:hypothetical protein
MDEPEKVNGGPAGKVFFLPAGAQVPAASFAPLAFVKVPWQPQILAVSSEDWQVPPEAPAPDEPFIVGPG